MQDFVHQLYHGFGYSHAVLAQERRCLYAAMDRRFAQGGAFLINTSNNHSLDLLLFGQGYPLKWWQSSQRQLAIIQKSFGLSDKRFFRIEKIIGTYLFTLNHVQVWSAKRILNGWRDDPWSHYCSFLLHVLNAAVLHVLGEECMLKAPWSRILVAWVRTCDV